VSYSEQSYNPEQAVDRHHSEERLMVRLEGYHGWIFDAVLEIEWKKSRK